MTNDWPGYGKQRQFLLKHATHEWVFSIDADEEVSSALRAEIEALDYRNDGYKVPRSVWYLNRWIKHGVWYPGYVLRLFRKENARVTDDMIHESIKVSGSIGRLQSDLLHYSYRDIEHHLDKMNEFTSISAGEMFEPRRPVGVARVVFYPFFEFFKTYIAKRGFLDGFAGFEISVFHAFYVFLKYAKLREMFSQPHESRPRDSSESADPPMEARR